MDLFERQYQQLRDQDAPLAARIRPRSITVLVSAFFPHPLTSVLIETQAVGELGS